MPRLRRALPQRNHALCGGEHAYPVQHHRPNGCAIDDGVALAGAAALRKYIATLEEWQMPPGLEESSGMEAVQKLCSCLAAALEQSMVRA